MFVGCARSESSVAESSARAKVESLFKQFAIVLASLVEAAAAVFIFVGAVEASVNIIKSFGLPPPRMAARKHIWLQFGVWLLLGLEFELAADVVRTAVSPTWTDISQLAAIAAIRTFLNYFLEKDLEKYDEAGKWSLPSGAGEE